VPPIQSRHEQTAYHPTPQSDPTAADWRRLEDCLGNFTYDIDLSCRFCGDFFTCERYIECHITAKVCCGDLAHKHSAHCERTSPNCQRKFTSEEIIDGTYTTHRKVSCIVKTNAEVGPSRGQSPVSHVAEDVAAQGPAEHGAFAQSLVLTGSILADYQCDQCGFQFPTTSDGRNYLRKHLRGAMCTPNPAHVHILSATGWCRRNCGYEESVSDPAGYLAREDNLKKCPFCGLKAAGPLLEEESSNAY
jgi:hypothetical protein